MNTADKEMAAYQQQIRRHTARTAPSSYQLLLCAFLEHARALSNLVLVVVLAYARRLQSSFTQSAASSDLQLLPGLGLSLYTTTRTFHPAGCCGYGS